MPGFLHVYRAAFCPVCLRANAFKLLRLDGNKMRSGEHRGILQKNVVKDLALRIKPCAFAPLSGRQAGLRETMHV